jgi:hypothetical protein
VQRFRLAAKKAIETGKLMAEHRRPAAAVGTDLPLCGIRILDLASVDVDADGAAALTAAAALP